jgi:hypothetical protein
MERPKTTIDPKNLNPIFEHIFTNGMGNILIRNEAPTANDMKANTMAYYNNELYLMLANGSLYKFTLTVV